MSLADMRNIIVAALVIAIVVVAGIAVALTSKPGTNSTSTLTSETSGQNCASNANGVDQWLTFKANPQRTGFTNTSFPSGGKFLGQLAWHNSKVGLSGEIVSLFGRVLAANWYLNAISMSNGSLLWSLATGAGPYPSLASDGRTVFLGSNGGGLIGFDPLTGKNVTSLNQVMALGATAICGGVAYVSSVPGFGYPQYPTGSLLAINLTTGKTLWGLSLTSNQYEGFPTTDGRFVYSVLTNNTLIAYLSGTGQRAWSKAFPQNLTMAPPVWNGELVVSTADGRVNAVNAASGSDLWSTKVNGSIEDTRSSAALGYGEVFLGTSEGFYALNATTGSVIWRVGTAGSTFGTPTVVGGMVFVADQGGTLHEFDASNGSTIWSYSGLGVGYVSEPIVANGIIVVDGNNGIFAFH